VILISVHGAKNRGRPLVSKNYKTCNSQNPAPMGVPSGCIRS
jgi:hypothetical protein